MYPLDRLFRLLITETYIKCILVFSCSCGCGDIKCIVVAVVVVAAADAALSSILFVVVVF
jgi:hypothetical protein